MFDIITGAWYNIRTVNEIGGNIIMALMGIRYLDLLWRIIGSNIILVLIGILQIEKTPELSSYVILSNLLLICYTIYQVVKRKLTMHSNIKDILIIYLVCNFVIDFVLIKNVSQCEVSIYCSWLEILWIVKYYMLIKRPS